MQAVILAGGEGSRLKPFTNHIPKPLVLIGDLPILEVVLRQLKYYGFTDIVLAVNHLSDLIMAFFGKGEKLGLNICYSVENRAMGTAGALPIFGKSKVLKICYNHLIGRKIILHAKTASCTWFDIGGLSEATPKDVTEF